MRSGLSTPASDHPIILYDGVCGMCNRLVRAILPRDPEGLFRFATLQGEFAGALLARHNADRGQMETLYVVLAPGTPEERLLSYSDAALYIAARLRGPLRMARIFRVLPRALRNWLYGLIARRRYRWFGKYETCPLPEPQWKDRFLD
jgi:predicted DCC family thiol-disulfide oxidoreductase YuxK